MEQRRKAKPGAEDTALSVFCTDSGNSVGKLEPIYASEQLLALGNLVRTVARLSPSGLSLWSRPVLKQLSSPSQRNGHVQMGSLICLPGEAVS